MPEPRTLICPHCGKPVSASVVGEAIWDGYDGDQPVNPPVEWTMVQCPRCRQPTVQIREDYGGGFDDDEPAVAYPAPQRLSWSVPEPLRREWTEARSCFDAKAYTACLVMVRRTLEGTCDDLGVKKPTLAKSLDALRTKGLIDGTLAEWADTLRLAGNRGAHFTGDVVPREDAEDALAFAEALLDHVYVLRKRFAAFKARVGKKPASS